MNPRNTWRWLLLVVALASLVFVHHRYFRKAQTGPAKILPGLNPPAVTSVQILLGQSEIRAARTNSGGWCLTQPLLYPAQATSIEILLRKLARLTPAASIDAGELKNRPKADEEFGFAKPEASILIEQGPDKTRLLVGAKTGPGDQLYLQVVGVETVYVVDTDLLKLVPRTADDWRDAGQGRQLLDVPVRPSIPPGGRREHAIETGTLQLDVASPGQSWCPGPKSAGRPMPRRLGDGAEASDGQKIQTQQSEAVRSCLGKADKMCCPPRTQPVRRIGAHRGRPGHGTLLTRIDDIVLSTAFEQFRGFSRAGAVGRQPVEHDIEAQPKAMLARQVRQRADGFVGCASQAQALRGPAEIGNQQRIVATRQERVEANMVETKGCCLGQALLPIAGLVRCEMTNARRAPFLQSRRPHPGLHGRGLQAPAHRY